MPFNLARSRRKRRLHLCYDPPLVRCFLFILLLGDLAHGQTLEDAVRQIAKNILASGDAAHVSGYSLAPEFAAETARAQSLLERALRRPPGRDAGTVEVVVTATRNVSGPLLVVQIQKGDEKSVETANYLSPPVVRVLRPALTASLLWEQQEPILDVAIAGDRMLVLSPAQIQRSDRVNGKWQPGISATLAMLAPSRDPRGKLVISDDNVTAFLSAGTCTGTWNPGLQLTCTQTAGEFQIEGEQFHFLTGENTLETANGEKLYSLARAGDFRLFSSTDGTIHGARGEQSFAFTGWGSDIASLAARCTGNPAVIASSPATADNLTAYEIAGPNPRAISDSLPLKGAVTALWPAPEGTLAVVHETATGRYAAYLVSLDCGN